MNLVTQIALAKYFTNKTKKAKLIEGSYNIQETITLNIEGLVKKSESCSFTPTVEIPLLATLALVLRKAGIQRKNAKDILISAMQEAILNEQSPTETIMAELGNVEEAIKHVQEITKSLPKKIREGQTNVTVFIKEVAPTGELINV